MHEHHDRSELAADRAQDAQTRASARDALRAARADWHGFIVLPAAPPDDDRGSLPGLAPDAD